MPPNCRLRESWTMTCHASRTFRTGFATAPANSAHTALFGLRGQSRKCGCAPAFLGLISLQIKNPVHGK
jgi:hypothetical protein